MKNLVAYILFGQDNHGYMLQDVAGLDRLSVCGGLRSRPPSSPNFRLKNKRDVSCTYDGYLVVSKRFIDEWERLGGLGLIFSPLASEPGYFSVDADCVVPFDAPRRGTRFEKLCNGCGLFHSIAGAMPAFLKTTDGLLANRAVKTDLMFGSGDGRSPLIIIPLGVGNALKCARLSGLLLDDVFV